MDSEDATHTVTHRYDGANVRSLFGQDVPRRYELAGRRLVLRSTRMAFDRGALPGFNI